jgi:hypothetical protein
MGDERTTKLTWTATTCKDRQLFSLQADFVARFSLWMIAGVLTLLIHYRSIRT